MKQQSLPPSQTLRPNIVRSFRLPLSHLTADRSWASGGLGKQGQASLLIAARVAVSAAFWAAALLRTLERGRIGLGDIIRGARQVCA